MKSFLPILLSLVILFGVAFSAPSISSVAQPEPLPIYAMTMNKEWIPICTSTPINTNPTLYLTAFHCVVEGGKLVKFSIGPNYMGTVWAVDAEDDLALLYTQFLDYKEGIRLASKSPRAEEVVHMNSFPLGTDVPHYSTGYIASLHTMFPGLSHPKMMFGISNCMGSSGSAVLNAKGEVVSVLQIGLGSPCAPVMGGVTYEKLKAFLIPWL